MSPTPFLTNPDVAALLGPHPESVRRMIREGRLPAFKTGRSWRVDKSELEAWQRSQRMSVRGGGHVLVVEDSEPIRDVVRITLEEAGLRVTLASAGEGAIALLSGQRPDLLLLDLQLPGLSGVDVLEVARDLYDSLPVIVLTGYPDSELMHRALEHGPFVVLAKPVEPPELLRTIERGMRRSRPSESAADRGAVVIIDDDQRFCTATAQVIKRLGYRATCAPSGAEGLALVAQDEPLAVVLDLLMPGLDGVDVLERLRLTHPALPVVLVTGQAQHARVAEAIRHPPILLLSKPVLPDELGRTLGALVSVGGRT